MIGIVYSEATGRIRWIMYPDADDELSAIRLGTGEAVHVSESEPVLVPLPDGQNVPDVHAWQAELNAVTGKNPDKSDDLYAIVDPKTGDVVGCITCDPLCGDKLAEHVLIKDAEADDMTGWKVDLQLTDKLTKGTVEQDQAKLDAIAWIEPIVIPGPPKPEFDVVVIAE